MSTFQPRVVGAVIVGAIGAVLSLLRVDSYDEVYWGVMAQRVVANGELPYFDMIDNKGPLLYVVIIGATLLPGPLSAGLAVVYGATVATLFERLTRLSESVGMGGTRPTWWSGVAIAFVTALTTGGITTELLASGFVVTALISHNTARVYAALLIAALIDPRAALFAIPATMRLRASGRFDHRSAISWVGVATVTCVVVATVPALRFSLIETSLATRDALDVGRFATMTLFVIAPLVVASVFAPVSRIEGWAVALLMTGAAVGALTMVAIGHYWIYLPLAFVALPWRPRSNGTWIAALATVTALSPLLPLLRTEVEVDRSITARSEQATSEIASILSPDDTVFVWSQFPHLRSPYADQTIGLAATSNIHGWSIGDHQRVTEGLRRDLREASLIVIDESLDPDSLRPDAHTAAATIAAHVNSSSCQTLGTYSVSVYRCAPPEALQSETLTVASPQHVRVVRVSAVRSVTELFGHDCNRHPQMRHRDFDHPRPTDELERCEWLR